MFDSAEELLRHIRLGEDTSLELKGVVFKGEQVAEPRRDKLADEIGAIANTRDGVLVLGVDDKTREVLGIPVDRLEAVERLIFEVCNDSIAPPVVFRSYRVELPDSTGALRAVLKIEIPRSLFVHRSPGGYFYRQGSSARLMPTEHLARLLQQRSQARLVPFDQQPVPETTLASLSESLWRRFVGTLADEAPTVLNKMKILTPDDSGQMRASVAGVLLCTDEPRRWLPGAFVQAVRYRGVERDANYQIDAQDLTGPLDSQVRDAIAFVRRNMTVAARKAPARADYPQFSIRAVFEAVVNAVAHRDYSIHGSKIRLFLFDDRLELYSPGPLPNTVTVDSMALRQSTRNELTTSLLARCPLDDPKGEIARSSLMEKRGEGVPIIISATRELTGQAPVYRVIDDSEVLLTIPGAEPPVENRLR